MLGSQDTKALSTGSQIVLSQGGGGAGGSPLPLAGSQIVLSPADGRYQVNTPFDVEIAITGAVNNLSGFEAHLSYDPAILEVQSISKGSSLNDDWLRLINKVDNSAGKVDIGYGTMETSAQLSGSNIKVAVLRLTAKNDGAVELNFDFDSDANRMTYYQVKTDTGSEDQYFEGQINGSYTIGWPSQNGPQITLLPATGSYQANTPFDVEIAIDGEVNNLSGFEAHLSYDPAILEVQSISKGSSLNDDWLRLINKVDNSAGKADIGYGTMEKSALLSGGDIKVAVLRLTAKNDGTAALNFEFDSDANRMTFYQVRTDAGLEDRYFNGRINGIYQIGQAVPGEIKGNVVLEGKKVHSGADVTLLNSEGQVIQTTFTTDDGSYTFNGIAFGKYSIVAQKQHCLSAEVSDIVLNQAQNSVILQPITLLAGDVVLNNKIDLRDLIAFARAYGKLVGENGYHEAADFDSNGSIELRDYLILKKNYAKSGIGQPVPNPLWITSVTPNQGVNTVATNITVNGNNFMAGASVTIGGYPAGSVQVINGQAITAVVPAGMQPGTYDVMVINPDGKQAVLAGGFTVTALQTGTQVILLPATGSYQANTPFDVEIAIAGEVNNLSGFEVHLSYDPAILEVQGISKGSSLSEDWLKLINKFNNSTGKVDIGYGTMEASALQSGSNIKVALLHLTAKKGDTAALNFDFDSEANRMTFYQVKNDVGSEDKYFDGYIDGSFTIR